MYTKDSTCGGFLEVRDDCHSFGKRNAESCCEPGLTTNAYDMESWKDPLQVTVGREVNYNRDSETMENVFCRNSWEEDHSKSRYVHTHNAVIPPRSNNEQFQLEKKRKHESFTDENGQVKRRKVFENLTVKEFKSEVSLSANSFPQKITLSKPSVTDCHNSTAHKTEELRGRFYRSAQPAVKTSSEGRLGEAEGPSGALARTSTQTEHRLAKENFTMRNQNATTRRFQDPPNFILNPEYLEPVVNGKFLSSGYSTQSKDSTLPFATTVWRRPQPFQPGSSPPSATIPIENSVALKTGVASNQTQRNSRVETVHQRFSFPGQQRSVPNNGSMHEAGWNGEMSFFKDKGFGMTHRPMGMPARSESTWLTVRSGSREEGREGREQKKENATTYSRCCYGKESLGENHSPAEVQTRERIAEGLEDVNDHWKNLESSCGRRLDRREERVLGPALDLDALQQQVRPPPYNNVAPHKSREMFATSENPTMHADESPHKTRARVRHEGNDGNDDLVTFTCPRRWTSPIGGDSVTRRENVTHTVSRAKSLSPALKSNVGGRNFGSLKSIRTYYKTMQKLKSPDNKRGERSQAQRLHDCPETRTDSPIDLSTRVRNSGHAKDGPARSNYLASAGVEFPDKSSGSAEQVGFQLSTHRASFDKHELRSAPNTRPSAGGFPSFVEDPEVRRHLFPPSGSLPGSRIGSPISDSHLPPKKRRIKSSDWISTTDTGSPSDGSRQRGRTWREDYWARSPGEKIQTGDRILEVKRSQEEEEEEGIQFSHATDLELTGKREVRLQRHDKIPKNLWNDHWALIPDDDGDLPLHIAVGKASENLVQKCLDTMYEFGIPVDIYNKKRKTPLHLAVISKQLDVVDLLLRACASPNVCDRNGDNSIHLAVKYQSVTCLKCLLMKSNHVIDLDARNSEGLTALHLAVLLDELEFVQVLLRAGANLNVADGKTGRMPLHFAAERNNEAVAELLLASGAKPYTASYSGSTPVDLQVVSAKSHLKMAKQLERSTYCP